MSPIGTALLLLLPVADLLTGLQYYLTATDHYISASRIHKGAILVLAVAMILGEGRVVAKPSFMLATALMGVFALGNGLAYGGLETNTTAFVQNQLFYCAVFSILALPPAPQSREGRWRYLWSTWLCISSSVLLSEWAGVGMMTYREYGSKGFLRAGNAASYLFVCASCCLVFARKKKDVWSITLLTIALTTGWILGTKAVLLGLAFCACWWLMASLSRSKSLTLAAAALAVVLAIVHAEPLFRLAAGYLPRAEHYEYALQREDDAVGVLLSDRDTGAEAALEILREYGPLEWLAGIGVHEFQRRVADLRSVKQPLRMVEMDWLDLLGGTGILGLLWFYGLLAAIARRSLRGRSPEMTAVTACALFTALFSLSAGHVATASSSLAMVAVLHAWARLPSAGSGSRR